MEESLFEQIQNAMTAEGELKPDFELNTEKLATTRDGMDVYWGEGTRDGLIVCGGGEAHAADGMIPGLKLIEEERYEEAAQALAEFLGDNPMIYYIDEMQNWIRTEGNPEKGEQYGLFSQWLMECAFQIELVKLGMSLAEILRIPDEMKDVIRSLSLAEEFSLYGIFCMRNWEGGNQEIFHLAKKVYGWGRVQALYFLEPETEEIKDWIFREGQYCEQLEMYTAQICAAKVDLLKRLEDPTLSYADFGHAQDLVRSLLEQNESFGLYEMEGKEEILAAYYKQAERQPLSERDKRLLEMIHDREDYFLYGDDEEDEDDD